jgi:hypothetical protein
VAGDDYRVLVDDDGLLKTELLDGRRYLVDCVLVSSRIPLIRKDLIDAAELNFHA